MERIRDPSYQNKGRKQLPIRPKAGAEGKSNREREAKTDRKTETETDKREKLAEEQMQRGKANLNQLTS